MSKRPRLTFAQIWNMSFGFLGIQFGFALQNGNASRILQTFGAEVDKLSLFWLVAPITGMIVQPIIGYMSDKTWNRLGRRRPYFLTGALLTSIALILMPNAPHLATFIAPMFIGGGLLMIMDASINISMEPFRALVADKLPEEQHTLGFSVQTLLIGIGAVIGSWLPYILGEWFGVSKDVPIKGTIPNNVVYSFYFGAFVLISSILWTVFTTPEYPPEELVATAEVEEKPKKFFIPPIMIKLLLVQFFSWFALFSMWVYTTPAVALKFYGTADANSSAYQDAMAFAIYGMAAMFAPAIGPTLGGWITDEFSWRWIFLINVPVGIMLFFAVLAMIDDPEHVRERRAQRRAKPIRIDYVGFGLLALGFGTLQLMLDQGEQRDWFSSGVIIAAGVTAVVSLTAFVLWVIGREDPIVDLSLLKNRNFAIANALMLMVGFSMFTTTALLPVMVQSLYGYTALLAGLVLSPGSFVIIFMMPLVAQMQKYVNARILIAIGLASSSLGLFVMTGINLQTDYWTISEIRILQLLGNAFLFGPVTTMAYQDMPNARSDGASAFLNLARNLGGTIGIAVLLTFLAHRTQFHHARMAEHISPGDPQYVSLVEAIQAKLTAAGAAGGDALMQAQAVIANMVNRQASMMGFLDCFYALAFVFAGLTLFALVMRGGKPARYARRGAPPERPAIEGEIV